MQIKTSQLLKQRTFLPLFLTQFLGAFNDNAFKFAMLTSISYYLSHSQLRSEYYQALAGAVFILPFFIFSATAGQLADKYDKAMLTKYIKLFEFVLMGLGGFGLYYGNILLLMTTLAGLGIHSTFFGPIKYAILPEQLPKQYLLGATAWLEASTFFAILLGTLAGTLSVGGLHLSALSAILLTLIAALLGLFTSFFILPTPEKQVAWQVNWHIGKATWQLLQEAYQQKELIPVICAISWFWLIGAVMVTKLPDYTNFVLHGEPRVFAIFLTCFSVGIGVGSITINQLLKGRVTLRYVPLAMLMLSLFTGDLFFATPVLNSAQANISWLQFFKIASHWRIAVDLFMLAACGGMFVVPLYTYLQIASDDLRRARTIAANNIINSLWMVLGTLFVIMLLQWKVTIVHVFLILACLNVVATITFVLLLYCYPLSHR